MNLRRIQHELIADRSAEGWYRINIAGPFFHYRVQYGWSPDGNYSYVTDEHREHAVCREEPSLTMSWGMDVHDREDRKELRFEWAEDFVNPAVHPIWVDFFWNNALIDRVELAGIDGGHGLIPIPDYEMKVTHFEVAVAYLVHELSGGPDHDHPGRYLDTIGATLVHDTAREHAGSPES